MKYSNKKLTSTNEELKARIDDINNLLKSETEKSKTEKSEVRKSKVFNQLDLDELRAIKALELSL